MSNLKQIDELTSKLVPQVLNKIYKLVDQEMLYSDIDFEPDGSECVKDYQDAHDYIMNQLLTKLISWIDTTKNYNSSTSSTLSSFQLRNQKQEN